MRKVFRKKALRDLKDNLFRYAALAILVILGTYIVVGLVGAADAVIEGTKEKAEKNHVEDGEFHLSAPLMQEERHMLIESGLVIEEQFYLDYVLADGSVLRIFTERETINLVEAECGRLPEREGEIFLERRCCEEHHIAVGDSILIADTEFTVCGIGTVPDYESPLRNFSDSAVDSRQFGFGFLTKEDYERLKKTGGSISSEEISYAYLLNGSMTDRQLKERLRGTESGESSAVSPKLLRFVPAEDNPRIGSAADDKAVDKAAGLTAGVIVFILFAYVIMVFTMHHMEKESGVIGVLYAMGVKRKELLRHYLTLPAFVTLTAGIIGTALGFGRFGIRVQMGAAYGYFSIPDVPVRCEAYLLLYGVVMPPLVTVLTNYFVIRKKLGRPVLALLNGRGRSVRAGNLRLRGGFVRVFRIRLLFREKRAAVTMFFGMLISLLIVMLALDCYTICARTKTETVADTKFEYLYTYKYPADEVPEGGSEAYGVVMKKERFGYAFDVTLLGIRADNPYFDRSVESGTDRVLISSAMAQKYRMREGDSFTLTDEENDRTYTFTVGGIVTYSAGFFVFMDIDSMRVLMGESSGYYNMVFSGHSLPIESERLYSVLSKEDIEKSASVFVTQMKGMIAMLLFASALVFMTVMYLMMKVMIERSAQSVSLFRIFGYRRGEIRKLFVNGNFFVVLLGALVGIPVSKAVMDGIFPLLISNIACGVSPAFSGSMYAGIFLGTLVLYELVSRILMHRVNRISPGEILKNRE